MEQKLYTSVTSTTLLQAPDDLDHCTESAHIVPSAEANKARMYVPTPLESNLPAKPTSVSTRPQPLNPLHQRTPPLNQRRASLRLQRSSIPQIKAPNFPKAPPYQRSQAVSSAAKRHSACYPGRSEYATYPHFTPSDSQVLGAADFLASFIRSFNFLG